MPLHLLLPLTIIPALLFGEISQRLRLPRVVGEIFCGIVLGPVLFGLIPSPAQDVPGFKPFHELAEIGLCALLFKIGLETRWGDLGRTWRPAMSVAIAGMVFPFLLGWGLASLWGWPQLTAVFIGGTLTATSIAVTASVLDEVGAQSSPEGLLILSAAVLDDLLGLLLLSALIALVTTGISVVGQVAISFLQALSLIIGGFLLGRFVVNLAVRLTQWTTSKATLIALAFSYFLLMAFVAKTAGLAMIIGAYAAGLAFARHPDRDQLEQNLQPLIGLLTPLFFILIGASIKFSEFSYSSNTWGESLGYVCLLFLVAITGKMLSPVFLRKEKLRHLVVGSGMMPRGEVGFVFAQIGLTTGILSQGHFSLLDIVLVSTTILGPLLLRFFLKERKVRMEHLLIIHSYLLSIFCDKLKGS
jgi:Kef-type K+ transport system membrane component KefB